MQSKKVESMKHYAFFNALRIGKSQYKKHKVVFAGAYKSLKTYDPT
jgi:hypothetical protein